MNESKDVHQDVEIKHIRERCQKMEASMKKIQDSLKEIKDNLEKTIAEIDNPGAEPTKTP